ncbi:MAG: hypothetical protein JWM58_3084 [Rhizobium sp.]|nr:hypothetical protein [Rhizobium sp.]
MGVFCAVRKKGRRMPAMQLGRWSRDADYAIGALVPRCRRSGIPGKKRGPRVNSGPYKCEGNLYLQRGTANAAALGGKPPCASTTGDMAVFCALHKRGRRMPAMQLGRWSGDVAAVGIPGKKRGPRENSGPYKCEGKLYLQRGTANAAALGGKPPCALTTGDMVVFCASRKKPRCMTGMQMPHTVWCFGLSH